MYSLEFELTADDFIAFNMRHATATDSYVRLAKRTRLSVTALTFVALSVLVGLSPGDLIMGLVLGVVGAAVTWLIFPWLWRRGITRNLHKLAKGNGLGTPGTRVLTVDEDGLVETGPGVQLTVAWDQVMRVDRSPHQIAIYFGPQAAILIPDTVGPEAAEALIREIELHRATA